MGEINPVTSVLEETLSNLKSIIDIDCIVGKTVKGEDNCTIIPISKVSIGFVSGGGEYKKEKFKLKNPKYPFAGGSGAGCNISPIGFLVINNGNVKFINIEDKSGIAKVFDFADKIADKINGGKKWKKDFFV